MIIKECKYDELRDVAPVDQFGFVNLNECLANGEVPATIADSEDTYNGIEDPSSIIGKPRDIFEAYSMQDYIKERGNAKSNSASAEPK